MHWGIAGNSLLAWLFTLPIAALAGAGMRRRLVAAATGASGVRVVDE